MHATCSGLRFTLGSECTIWIWGIFSYPCPDLTAGRRLTDDAEVRRRQKETQIFTQLETG